MVINFYRKSRPTRRRRRDDHHAAASIPSSGSRRNSSPSRGLFINNCTSSSSSSNTFTLAHGKATTITEVFHIISQLECPAIIVIIIVQFSWCSGKNNNRREKHTEQKGRMCWHVRSLGLPDGLWPWCRWVPAQNGRARASLGSCQLSALRANGVHYEMDIFIFF